MPYEQGSLGRGKENSNFVDEANRAAGVGETAGKEIGKGKKGISREGERAQLRYFAEGKKGRKGITNVKGNGESCVGRKSSRLKRKCGRKSLSIKGLSVWAEGAIRQRKVRVWGSQWGKEGTKEKVSVGKGSHAGTGEGFSAKKKGYEKTPLEGRKKSLKRLH